jgi:hypothetical protein
MGESFRHAKNVLQTCGHDMPSDPDFDPHCGSWTHDELAILYAALRTPQMAGKSVVDIGARFGWTAKAIHEATKGVVLCVDPILQYGKPEFERFRENLGTTFERVIPIGQTANHFFVDRHLMARKSIYAGWVIDGNHDAPEPLNDAKGAVSLAEDDCMILLHDGRGLPIQQAVAHLMHNGFNAKFYATPNGIFVCWRGLEGWEPPHHLPDPNVDWRGVIADAVAAVGRPGLIV